jgi:hypothetical protein
VDIDNDLLQAAALPHLQTVERGAGCTGQPNLQDIHDGPALGGGLQRPPYATTRPAASQAAVGRYSPFCPSDRGSFVGGREQRTCAREFLGRVTRVYPDLLDVGALGSEAPYLPMANHSHYK